MAMFDECIWCYGGPVVCALCGETIVCMFCIGTGEFTPEPQLAAHRCASLGMSAEAVVSGRVQ
jgi:hypothetical protein